MEQIAAVREFHDVQKNASAEEFFDFHKVKDSIVIKVVGEEANRPMLLDMPHRSENDMAIIYQILLKQTDEGMTAIKVTNELMEHFGVNEQTIHDVALENTQRQFPATFRPMHEVIKEIMRKDFMGIDLDALPEEDDMKVFLESLLEEGIEEMGEDAPLLYVLTNDCKINGAAVLFYPGMKEQIAEQLGGDYFVLPSSIHEVLVLADQGNMDYRELKDMVNEVNETEVAPDEVLTGEVYFYDRESKQLLFASEKEEKSNTVEKAGKDKPSIMDMLKEKTEEVIHEKPQIKLKSSELEL